MIINKRDLVNPFFIILGILNIIVLIPLPFIFYQYYIERIYAIFVWFPSTIHFDPQLQFLSLIVVYFRLILGVIEIFVHVLFSILFFVHGWIKPLKFGSSIQYIIGFYLLTIIGFLIFNQLFFLIGMMPIGANEITQIFLYINSTSVLTGLLCIFTTLPVISNRHKVKNKIIKKIEDDIAYFGTCALNEGTHIISVIDLKRTIILGMHDKNFLNHYIKNDVLMKAKSDELPYDELTNWYESKPTKSILKTIIISPLIFLTCLPVTIIIICNILGDFYMRHAMWQLSSLYLFTCFMLTIITILGIFLFIYYNNQSRKKKMTYFIIIREFFIHGAKDINGYEIIMNYFPDSWNLKKFRSFIDNLIKNNRFSLNFLKKQVENLGLITRETKNLPIGDPSQIKSCRTCNKEINEWEDYCSLHKKTASNDELVSQASLEKKKYDLLSLSVMTFMIFVLLGFGGGIFEYIVMNMAPIPTYRPLLLLLILVSLFLFMPVVIFQGYYVRSERKIILSSRKIAIMISCLFVATIIHTFICFISLYFPNLIIVDQMGYNYLFSRSIQNSGSTGVMIGIALIIFVIVHVVKPRMASRN